MAPIEKKGRRQNPKKGRKKGVKKRNGGETDDRRVSLGGGNMVPKKRGKGKNRNGWGKKETKQRDCRPAAAKVSSGGGDAGSNDHPDKRDPAVVRWAL